MPSKTRSQEPLVPSEILDVKGKEAWRKGSFLGRGGFAYCYKVTNVKTGKTFAGKVVSKDNLKKKSSRARLLNEIEIHRSLAHDNVVGFKQFFEDSNNVYIVLELCTNKTLKEMVDTRGALQECEVQYYMWQMLDVIEYLHSENVIHRDLKLGNLFLSDNMEIKLGDFGLATRLAHKGERKRTICGTPNYIAPEVLNSKHGHSFEADIWSMGVIMYTMLFGKPPFHTRDAKTTYKRIRASVYDFPQQQVVSAAAKTLIASILQPNPAHDGGDRTPSMVTDVQSFLQQQQEDAMRARSDPAEHTSGRRALASVENHRQAAPRADSALGKKPTGTLAYIAEEHKALVDGQRVRSRSASSRLASKESPKRSARKENTNSRARPALKATGLPLHPKQAQGLRVGALAALPRRRRNNGLDALAPVLPAGRRLASKKLTDCPPLARPVRPLGAVQINTAEVATVDLRLEGLPRKTHRSLSVPCNETQNFQKPTQENPPMPTEPVRMVRSRSVESRESDGQPVADTVPKRRLRRSKSVSEQIIPDELSTPKQEPRPAFAVRAPVLSPDTEDTPPSSSTTSESKTSTHSSQTKDKEQSKARDDRRQKKLKRGETAKLLGHWELDSRTAAKSLHSTIKALKVAHSDWTRGGRRVVSMTKNDPGAVSVAPQARTTPPGQYPQRCSHSPGVFITYYRDERQYGLFFLLSDGRAGACFRDGTSAIVDKAVANVAYFDNDEDPHREHVYPIANYPSNLEKRMVLLKHFVREMWSKAKTPPTHCQKGVAPMICATHETCFMCARGADAIDMDLEAGVHYKPRPVKWLATSTAMIFRFSDGAMQALFLDGSQVYLSSPIPHRGPVATTLTKLGVNSTVAVGDLPTTMVAGLEKRLDWMRRAVFSVMLEAIRAHNQ